MRLAFLPVLLLASTSVVAGPTRHDGLEFFECSGKTVKLVDNIIRAQNPFHAIFKIHDDKVTLVEGDGLPFPSEYVANHDLSRPDRPGYESSNGIFLFYKASGRFEIFQASLAAVGPNSVETRGKCKSYEPD